MPSIVNGLFAGRAGIQSHGAAISVLADNIANSNTTAFKSARPDFTDLLAASIGGSSGSVAAGNGSAVSSVTPIFNQGTFEFTGRGLDVAIEGDGFFIVGENSGRFYSRAGNFQVRNDGLLVNQNGLPVLGFPSDGSSGLQSLNVNAVSQSNVSTTSVSLTGNLDASAPVVASPGGTDFTALNNAAAFSTFVEVFDSLGASHTVTMFYFHTNSATRTWSVEAYVDAGEVGGVDGNAQLLGSTTLTFDANGAQTTPLTPITMTPAWDNGSSAATNIDINFDPYTQFSAPSAVNSISQNGQGVGNIVSLSVEADGTLFAQLDNGLTSSIGTVALATFANPEGLKRSGASLYTETSASGEPVVGTPGTGKFGSTESGALELSTADIAEDFIKLISYQRGFQGSSRVITAIDELLNEIINLA